MTEQDFIEILQERKYTKLWIKRMEYNCSLIVDHDGKSNVYVKKNGDRLSFRHGWQWKEWLKQRFDIDLEESTQ